MYRSLVFTTVLAGLSTLAAPAAQASAPDLDPSWSPSSLHFLQEIPAEDAAVPEALDIDLIADPEGKSRDYDMEISFRGRMMGVPSTILDIWYYNEDDPSWGDSRDRPDIDAYSLGIEFVIKGESANGIFYMEYVKSRMKEGYWDDREEPADPLDGDFLRPSNNLGMAVFGANYAYEAHFVRTSQTNGAFGLSFLVGGGLGLGVLFGDLERWGPGDTGTPANVRFDLGEEADGNKDGIPPVLPMVDINAGLRFNFGDRFVLRFEGGLHTMLYYGATAGIMF